MKSSLWLNVDPLATYNPIFENEFYFDGDHNGGIYNNSNLNSYAYCYQNPIKYVDPNGKQNETVDQFRTTRSETERLVNRTYVDVESTPRGFKFNRSPIVNVIRVLVEAFNIAQNQSPLDRMESLQLLAKPNYATTKHYQLSSAFGISNESLTELKNKSKNKSPDGSYTIIYENGKKYHGKGPISRMAESALRYTTSDNEVKSLDWKPAKNAREAFKDEHTRMQTDKNDINPQGYTNPVNYNIRQSPGYNYKLQDGESVE